MTRNQVIEAAGLSVEMFDDHLPDLRRLWRLIDQGGELPPGPRRTRRGRQEEVAMRLGGLAGEQPHHLCRAIAPRGADRHRPCGPNEARAMPEDRIVRFLHLLAGANDEEMAEMAYEALQSMDAAAAIDVCVGWVEQANQVNAMHEALLELMAAQVPAG